MWIHNDDEEAALDASPSGLVALNTDMKQKQKLYRFKDFKIVVRKKGKFSSIDIYTSYV